jgi:hypothetical protein
VTSLAAVRRSGGQFVVLCLGLLLAGPVRAGDPTEFWPELNLYKGLGPATRLYFVAAYADGKESDFRTLDLAAYLDVTFKPLLRDRYKPNWRSDQDWRQKRYAWLRVGFDYVSKQATADGTSSTPEYRGIVAALGRAYLPAGILVETRFRLDLRWIGADYSTRFRPRIEVNRDFDLFGTVVTPYVQAELFYDTRYDGWARQLYQVGAEVTLTRHFRVEPFFARQIDRLPSASGLWSVGIVARWYY